MDGGSESGNVADGADDGASDTSGAVEAEPCAWEDVPLPYEIAECVINGPGCQFYGVDFSDCHREFAAWEDAGRPWCESGDECEMGALASCLQDTTGFNFAQQQCETWQCEQAWHYYETRYATDIAFCFHVDNAWPDCEWEQLQFHLEDRAEDEAMCAN